MSPQPPSPPDRNNPRVLDTEDRKSAASPDQRRPRTAILNAAIVCLDYAKQYLDKFVYWPDYILATHYHASVLALTGSEENRRDAERYFKDVEFWLHPADKDRQIGEDARRRIRAEAMYNRAVLLQHRGEHGKAKDQFESVLNVIGRDREKPPKGVRLAAEFALVMLEGRGAGAGDVSGKESSEARVSQPLTADQTPSLTRAAVPFLENCRRELQLLQSNLLSAEREVKSLEGQAAERRRVSKKKGERGRGASEDSAIRAKLENAKARITKASKDAAIVRMMIATAEKLTKNPPSAEGYPGVFPSR